jgi:hypothetical protein
MNKSSKSISRYIPVDESWENRFIDNTIFVKMYVINHAIKIDVYSKKEKELWLEYLYLSDSALELDWNFYFQSLFLSIPDYVTRDYFLEKGFIDKNFLKKN